MTQVNSVFTSQSGYAIIKSVERKEGRFGEKIEMFELQGKWCKETNNQTITAEIYADKYPDKDFSCARPEFLCPLVVVGGRIKNKKDSK